MEIWKPIEGYEDYYKVSNLGNVFSIRNNKLLKVHIRKQKKSKGLRCYVSLSKNGISKVKAVSRLVAIAFIPNPLNLETVNHKNGKSDDNFVDNLEWMSMKDNINHAFENGLGKKIHEIMGYEQKGVYMIEKKTNKILKEFNNLQDACAYFGKENKGHINRAIKRKGSCMGYKWAWKNEGVV